MPERVVGFFAFDFKYRTVPSDHDYKKITQLFRLFEQGQVAGVEDIKGAGNQDFFHGIMRWL